MHIVLRASAALCALASVPANAHSAAEVARAAEASLDPAADPAIVVTGLRIAEAEADADRRPGGADIVAGTDYQNVVAVSLRDALAFSPGVYTQPRYGQEIRLSIRGSGISRAFHMRGLTLLQDGVPINQADDNGDFQELDPNIMQHIEVYRGANALRFGGTTLGGGINAVTPTGRSAPGMSLRIDGGSFDTLRGLATFGYADARGDAWMAIAGDTSSGDRQHMRRQALRFHGNAGLRLSDAVETRFYASAQTIEQEIPGALNLATALDAPRTGSFFGDYARDIDLLRLQNRTTIDLASGQLELGGFLNAKSLFHPIFQVVDQESTDWGLFARLDFAQGPFAFTLGSTARFGRVDAKRFINVNGERGALFFDAEFRARTIDLYGEGRYRLGDLSLILGGVFSHGSRVQHQVFPAAIVGRFSDDQVSPHLGLLYEPREDLQFYANYSRSHEMPGFIELGQIAAFVPLESQRAWTGEIGARGRFGIARFDISLYRAALRGELLQFDIGPNIPAATFNADRTLHQGIEAGLDVDLTPWARLRQVYQLNDFRFRNDAQFGDNRLPVIPRHLYRAELRIGTDAISVAPAVEWVPQGAWADYQNSLRVDGYATLGVTAEASFRKGLTLFADARNLTGTNAIGEIAAAVRATPASAIFYPIERRAFYGGVRARF